MTPLPRVAFLSKSSSRVSVVNASTASMNAKKVKPKKKTTVAGSKPKFNRSLSRKRLAQKKRTSSNASRSSSNAGSKRGSKIEKAGVAIKETSVKTEAEPVPEAKPVEEVVTDVQKEDKIESKPLANVPEGPLSTLFSLRSWEDYVQWDSSDVTVIPLVC